MLENKGNDERRSTILVAESIESSSKTPLARGKAAFSDPMAMELTHQHIHQAKRGEI